MPFDYKKEQKELYRPKTKPSIINVPVMNFLAVKGTGNPNEENGEYTQAIGLLYPIAYALKMSYKTDYKIEGFFEYVVPPLEGYWWQENIKGVDLTRKDQFNWISMIRLPDFITKKDFDWAINKMTEKKKLDFSKVQFITIEEGLCVQCMHIGPFDSEINTVNAMHEFMEENGYALDINNETRFHHEIYLSDFRKVDPLKMKTVIRHPIIKR